eukprot:345289-Chlamydomonas_euryale.AAC.5
MACEACKCGSLSHLDDIEPVCLRSSLVHSQRSAAGLRQRSARDSGHIGRRTRRHGQCPACSGGAVRAMAALCMP